MDAPIPEARGGEQRARRDLAQWLGLSSGARCPVSGMIPAPRCHQENTFYGKRTHSRKSLG